MMARSTQSMKANWITIAISEKPSQPILTKVFWLERQTAPPQMTKATMGMRQDNGQTMT